MLPLSSATILVACQDQVFGAQAENSPEAPLLDDIFLGVPSNADLVEPAACTHLDPMVGSSTVQGDWGRVIYD
jgi:hypothetical protein